jgi:asparagine synthase (glutamine-hydrolysing)
MCGIAGFFDLGNAPSTDPSVLRAMGEAMLHRGPDGHGEWYDSGAGIGFAHRRLAIVDLTEEGRQPMRSHDGRWVIAFNGEIYNFLELRAELEQERVRFRGRSDTEVLLASVARWGVSATLPRLVGMFAFSLWDSAERILYLARDRVGEKPLYYGRAGNALLFGSELKALRAHPKWAGRIDREALDLFLRLGYVPAPHSIYGRIRKILPGTVVRIAPDGTETTERYWSLEAVLKNGAREAIEASDVEIVDELERLLSRAVGQQMLADVPLGAFLSGGVDSSTVVALMQARSDRPIKTFTIAFEEERFDETTHAERVARHIGTDHTAQLVTSRDARDVVPLLPRMFDEPFGDSSQIPTHLVAAAARKQVTVSLSGDGGDELFAGYHRYSGVVDAWKKLGLLPQPVRAGIAQAFLGVPTRSWDRLASALGRAFPWAAAQRMPGDRLHKAASVFRARTPEGMSEALSAHWPVGHGIVREASGKLGEAPLDFPRETELLTRLTARDVLEYLPDDILAKVDRATMSVSLESRAPLLDHRIVEFAYRIPNRARLRNGTGKWVLKELLYRHVPKELVERPKMGFSVPVESWLRGPLREWGEALLSPSRLSDEGYLDPEPVQRLWSEHQSGARNWQAPLWDVLMFQAWLAESN